MSIENTIVLPVVVNKYKVNMDDPDVVYIGRGSIWGNPYRMLDNSDAERERVIFAYRKRVADALRCGDLTIPMLLELRGKRLACFCSPKPYHGDVLVKAVEWAYRNNLSQPLDK